MVEFSIHNGNYSVTHESIQFRVNPTIISIQDDTEIKDGTSFGKNIEQAQIIIEESGLNRNKVDPKTSLIKTSHLPDEHLETLSQRKRIQILNPIFKSHYMLIFSVNRSKKRKSLFGKKR